MSLGYRSDTIIVSSALSPGFYFDYTIAGKYNYLWPGGKKLPHELIVESRAQLALVVTK